MGKTLIDGALSANLVQSGTVEFSYPDGKNKGSFTTYDAALVTDSNDSFTTKDGQISVSLGATSATVTLEANTSIASGTGVILELNEFGHGPYKDQSEYKETLVDTVEKTRLQINLGNPAASDTDGIADGISATDSAQSYTSSSFTTAFQNDSNKLDVPRNVTITGSAGADHVVTISGKDIYGDVVKENLTASGTTTIQGNKAFYEITGIDIAAGAASDTMDVGWGNKLGIPVFLEKWNDIVAQYVDDELIATNEKVRLEFDIEATELAAGTSEFVASPVYGFVSKATTVVQETVGTGGDVTFEIGGAAVTGLTVTVADSAAAGDIDTDTATDEFGSTGEIAKDGALEVVPASAFAASGALNGFAEITPGGAVSVGSQSVPSATTGDVKGTWTPPTALTPNGSRTYTLEVCVADAGYLGADNYDG